MLPCWTWLLVVCLNTMQTEVRQRKRFCWLLSLLIPIFDPSILFVFCSENKKKKFVFCSQKKKKKKFFTVHRLEINISNNSLKSDWRLVFFNERRHFDFCLWILLCAWRNMWVWRNGKLWHLHFCLLKGHLQINIGFIDGVKYVRGGRKQILVTDLHRGKIKIQKHLALS